ncbi:MAG: hypothetical protein K0Q65_1993 [Clostridia bacterium]|nr:hypothetical protein [Clostridia bacterium]
MISKRVRSPLIILIFALLILTSCSNQIVSSKTISKNIDSIYLSPQHFLESYGLTTESEPSKFNVTVPDTWEIELGAYPEGLYWALANEYSKDAGLDLTLLKGKMVEVWRYPLKGGLPGQGSQSEFSYPSNIVLLVENDKIVGAWLSFNVWGIGPSVKQNYLEDITGLAFEEWFYQQSMLVETEENKDLAALGPTEVLDAFFKAIEEGDLARADACLSPTSMLDSLTMNLQENQLYNPKYDTNNSYVRNILEATPISYKLLDPQYPANEVQLEDRTEIEVLVNKTIKWNEDAFNSPDGIQTRFSLLKKHPNGWKILGLGTGP